MAYNMIVNYIYNYKERKKKLNNEFDPRLAISQIWSLCIDQKSLFCLAVSCTSHIGHSSVIY